MSPRPALAFLAMLAFLFTPDRAEAAFTPGDCFASSGPYIYEFTQAGQFVRSIRIGGSATRTVLGVTIGPDGLLYAVVSNSPTGVGYQVLALTSTGVIRRTYLCADFIGGNISFGKIAFDTSGHFYVGDGAGVARFTVGSNAPGVLSYSSPSNGIFGVASLPNGHMLITSAYQILEITSAGAVVRPVGGFEQFVDLRGVIYDAATNVIYATMLGYTGNEFQLMKLDPTTGAVLASVEFVYGDGLALTPGGDLLVGSRTQSPALFDPNLNLLMQYSNVSPSLFVAVAPGVAPRSRSVAPPARVSHGESILAGPTSPPKIRSRRLKAR